MPFQSNLIRSHAFKHVFDVFNILSKARSLTGTRSETRYKTSIRSRVTPVPRTSTRSIVYLHFCLAVRGARTRQNRGPLLDHAAAMHETPQLFDLTGHAQGLCGEVRGPVAHRRERPRPSTPAWRRRPVPMVMGPCASHRHHPADAHPRSRPCARCPSRAEGRNTGDDGAQHVRSNGHTQRDGAVVAASAHALTPVRPASAPLARVPHSYAVRASQPAPKPRRNSLNLKRRDLSCRRRDPLW